MATEKKTVHDFEFVGRLINIMKILQEETDEFNTITQPEILELLRGRDCACSERTLTDYLKTIMKELNPEDVDGYVFENATIEDYVIIAKGLEEKLKARDYGLTTEGSKKLQLRSLRFNQLFSFAELNQVIEGVLFLKHIDDASKEKIIRKLLSLSSKNFPKYSPYISENTGTISKKIAGVFEDSRLDEVALKNNLQIIRKAIEANKGAGTKIAFHFNGYDENKKLKVRTDSDGNKLRYVANPYYIIMYNGKPYLICAMNPYDNVAIYRIDLMSDITTEIKPSLAKDGSMVSEKRRPKSEIKGLPMDWNLKEASKFQTEHLYMYYGKPESISLKIDKDRYTLLHDYFGDRYQFVEHIDDTWDYLTDKLFEVRKAIDMLFLGDKDMQAKLIRITDETEEFVRTYERPGVVTRWKRINPQILFFECAFDLMEECPDMYQQISWELTDLKLVCYPDESLIEARKRYFKEEKRKIEDGNLRYSEDRVFQNELLRTLKRVFEHDFRAYL